MIKMIFDIKSFICALEAIVFIVVVISLILVLISKYLHKFLVLSLFDNRVVHYLYNKCYAYRIMKTVKYCLLPIL